MRDQSAFLLLVLLSLAEWVDAPRILAFREAVERALRVLPTPLEVFLEPTLTTETKSTPPAQPRPFSLSNLSPRAKLILVAAIVYIALPIDVVPGVGIIGDLTALLVAINTALNSANSSRGA